MQKAGDTLALDAAAFVQETLMGEGAVAVLRPEEGSALTDSFYAGLGAALQQGLPGTRVLWQILPAGSNGAGAMREILEEMPEVNVVLGSDDATVLSALEAYRKMAEQPVEEGEEAQDFVPGELYFGAMGASDAGLAALAEGGAFRASVGLDAYRCGVRLTDMAVDLMEGRTAVQEEILPILVNKAEVAEFAE